VSETITSVRVHDRETRSTHELGPEDCGFSYRSSVFKRTPNRWVVLAVTYALDRQPQSRPVRYAELARELGIEVGEAAPLREVREAVLAIVGEEPLREQLLATAAAEGVQARGVLAGRRADARAVLGAADVALLSSRWEGLPLVALEAAAAGIPLVATSVRGLRELLTHDEEALLVPYGDAAALGEALRRAINDTELRDRLRSRGLALAKRYGDEAMVERHLELYSRLAHA